jgi:hypothetical protein
MAKRFQFRLRTLMIAVTLLALPMGYVGWQATIVRERKATAREIVSLGGAIHSASLVFKNGPEVEFSMGDKFFKPPYPSVSLIRRWLGDDYVVGIALPPSTPHGTEERISAVFPEAMVLFDRR